MRIIYTKKGEKIKVDNADYHWLNQYSWYITKQGYAAARVHGTCWLMHRFILGLTDPRIHTDHINLDRTDNRRSNLRACTQAENNCNSRSIKDTTSKFKGVSWNKRDKKWEVRITVKGKYKFLGYFNCEKQAAEAYDEAAKKYQKEFANLNF